MSSPFRPDLAFPAVPTKPVESVFGAGRNQKDRRWQGNAFDNHRHASRRGGIFAQGRPWTGIKEFCANRDHERRPTDGFINDLQPGMYVEDGNGIMDRHATLTSGWEAPWYPSFKYAKWERGFDRFRWDYPAMRLHEQQGYDRYYEAAALLGAGLNIMVEYGVTPHFQITSKLGRPTKLLPVIDAAMGGNPWLLGFTDEVDTELAKLLGYNERNMRFSYTPETPDPIVTPEQVLATPQADLLKMVAEMAAAAASAAVQKAFEAREQYHDDRPRPSAKQTAARKANAAKASAAASAKRAQSLDPAEVSA